jgi:hypothetical protein
MTQEQKLLRGQQEAMIIESAIEFAKKAGVECNEATKQMILAGVRVMEGFYEQSILPEVLKEKDEKFAKEQEWHVDYENKLCEERASLQSQLSQLQKGAFEAARIFEGDSPDLTKPFLIHNKRAYKYPTAEDYLKSTTPSTESGNPRLNRTT